MAIDFPNSPATNDIFAAAGKTWRYNSVGWVLVGIVSSDALSTTALNGGTPTTIQFHVMSAVNAGGV